MWRAVRSGRGGEGGCAFRPQARDLLQHLWTGPISNAPVEIVQGSKSVEVRPAGISKVCRTCELIWKVIRRLSTFDLQA